MCGCDPMGDRSTEEEGSALAELSALYRVTSIALASMTTDLEFLRVNGRLARFHGKSPGEFVGKCLPILIPGRATEARDAARQLLATGELIRGVNILSPPASAPGPEWDETWYAQWWRDKVVGISVAIVPKSVAELIQNDLQQQASLSGEHHEKAQRLESLGRFAGGVAHDFNNLLTVLGGNLELILHRPFSTEKVQRLASSALEAVATGKRLTEHMLAFAQQRRLLSKIVNVLDVLKGCQDLLKRAAGEASIVAFEFEEDLWPCRIDPTQLETALLNLILNARDAMPRGGTITFTAQNVTVDDKQGAVVGLDRGSYVLIAVTDTGEGMSAGVSARAFEPFFTTKPPGKGTGLGLSTVHGFAKQMGGSAIIRTAPGAGTTVELYFPKGPKLQARPSIDEERRAVPRGGSALILVVEDDEGVLNTIAELVADLGYRTIEATSGRDALEVLRRRPEIRLILTDVVMPGGMSGIELAREARRVRADVKILLTSGYAEDLVSKANTDDDFPLLAKPLRQDDLARALDALCAGGV